MPLELETRMKAENGAKSQRPRQSYTLCHEAAHYILQEQKRRVRDGEPHTHKNDIVNDWLIEAGKAHGHKPYSKDSSSDLLDELLKAGAVIQLPGDASQAARRFRYKSVADEPCEIPEEFDSGAIG
jgi:hypothetical protein